MDIALDQYAADGKLFPFKWEGVNRDPAANVTPFTDPVQDRVQAGGKEYAMKAGRVFLVDLTATPPTVAQADADLGQMFEGTGETVTGKELKAVVARLSAANPAVKAFLTRIPTKP